jgi:hypothetical protein
VAPLGTALTDEQAELLVRFVKEVFLLYDATKRARNDVPPGWSCCGTSRRCAWSHCRQVRTPIPSCARTGAGSKRSSITPSIYSIGRCSCSNVAGGFADLRRVAARSTNCCPRFGRRAISHPRSVRRALGRRVACGQGSFSAKLTTTATARGMRATRWRKNSRRRPDAGRSTTGHGRGTRGASRMSTSRVPRRRQHHRVQATQVPPRPRRDEPVGAPDSRDAR